MLEVPAPVSSFEVWLFEEEAGDQDLVWLCHSRGKGSLSVSPCFPKALLQSRSTEWSLAAQDLKGYPQGFGHTWPAATPYPLGFLLLSSRGHTSMAESTSLLPPAAVKVSFAGKEKTTSGSLAGA